MRIHPRPLVRCTMRLSAACSAIRGKATIAILVVFGLLLIPVECSVALGPHTLFISADAVAALQGDKASHTTHHASGQEATQSTIAHQALPDAPHDSDASMPMASDDHAPGSAPTSGSTGTHFSSTPARPAGISADAVVTIALPGDNPPLLAANDDVDALLVVSSPPDRLLIGPEPPPP